MEMYLQKKWMRKGLMAVCGKLEISNSQRQGLAFAGAFIAAGLVLSTLVFPFWNFIREDVYEEVDILANDNGVCYVETQDDIPKTIENCDLQKGDKTTIKYGHGLAWGTIVEP